MDQSLAILSVCSPTTNHESSVRTILELVCRVWKFDVQLISTTVKLGLKLKFSSHMGMGQHLYKTQGTTDFCRFFVVTQSVALVALEYPILTHSSIDFYWFLSTCNIKRLLLAVYKIYRVSRASKSESPGTSQECAMDKNGHGTRIAGIVGGHRRPVFFSVRKELVACGEEFTGGKTQVLVRKNIGKTIPIGSMYAIYGNIYHQYTPFMLAYNQHHGSVMG